MPIFVAAGAAAAYSYYKKRSSHLSEEEEGGEQAEAEEGGCGSTSCDCIGLASANDPSACEAKAHADKVARISENVSSQAGGGDANSPDEATRKGGQKENDRPAPLLEKWNKKYGAAGRGGANNSDRDGQGSSSHSTSVSGSEGSVSDDAAIAGGTISAPGDKNGSDAASAKDEKTENAPASAGNATDTLLQSWNERYPHLAKNSKRRQRRFDGSAGKMVRNLLVKRSPSAAGENKQQQPKVETNNGCTELSSKEEEHKNDDSFKSDAEKKKENDFGWAHDALYKEVATAVFGDLNNQ